MFTLDIEYSYKCIWLVLSHSGNPVVQTNFGGGGGYFYKFFMLEWAKRIEQQFLRSENISVISLRE